MKRNILFIAVIMVMLVALQGCGGSNEATGSAMLLLRVRPLAEVPPTGPVTDEQIEVVGDIIKERLMALGVEGVTVRPNGENHITVEFPAPANLDEVTKVVLERGLLELIDTGSEPLPEGTLVATELGGAAPSQPGGAGKVYKVVMTSNHVDASTVSTSTDPMGQASVLFSLKPEGAQRMKEHTSGAIGTYMPVVLDKRVISSPSIQGIIKDNVEITGLTEEETRRLAAQLKSGALPVELELIASRQPTPPHK